MLRWQVVGVDKFLLQATKYQVQLPIRHLKKIKMFPLFLYSLATVV